MHARPMFTPVKLYFVTLRAPLPGQFLQAQTRTRATYLIQAARQSPSHKRRWNLDCVRWPPDEIPAGRVVLPLKWFKREKKRQGHTARARQ